MKIIIYCLNLWMSALLLTACGGGSEAPTTLEPDSSVGDDSGNDGGNDGDGNNNESDENDTASSALNLPDSPFNYANIPLPQHFLENGFNEQTLFQFAAIELDNTPIDNPITDHGATLGRVLFFDKKLSANGTIACASCHLPEHGFADPNALSIGFDGEHTRRHSMSLVNARFYLTGKFFWDERADTLEDQVLMPFQDPVEMGLTLDELETIVQAQDYYPQLFLNAFGNDAMSSEQISLALAQFIRAMVSTTAPYDIARADVTLATDDFPAFTEQQNLGKRLFFRPRQLENGRANCAGCHISEVFVGPIPNVDPLPSTTSVNNGLDLDSTDDQGVFEVTGNPRDVGKFKSPSLRNIAIRPPYMHDGRFATLEQVIAHYSTGVQDHPTLSNGLRDDNGDPVRFNFTAEETTALIAFLETLTDSQMLSDEKFSNPFIEN